MKKTIYLLLITFFAINIYGQKKFMFDADYGIFKYKDTKSYLEIYFSFYHNTFKYNFSDNIFNANAYLQVQLKNSDDNLVLLDKEFGMKIKTSDTTYSKLKNKEISQIVLFVENNKNYTLNLIGSDNEDIKRTDTVTFNFFVPNHETESIKLSDIQLANSIEKSTNKESSFYKFGYEVVPNANSLFGNNVQTLFYYFEIYNLRSEENANAKINALAIRNTGDTIYTFSETINNIKPVMSQTGGIKVDSFPSGTYNLAFQIISADGKILGETSKKFYIFNTTKQIYSTTDEKDFLKSEFVSMNEKDMDDEFSKLVYITSDVEKKEYEKVKDVNEKRKFLFYFWKRKDTNPLTSKVEIREEYLNRFKKANSLYKQSFTDGWKTDRGRIYIMYGAPDEIDRNEMGSDVSNYEIWTYNSVEGGATCVFAETSSSGQGIYRLVHSTLRNELRDDQWMERLKKIR